MEKETRNKIRRMVQDARAILETEIGELLEGVFGLHRDGSMEDISLLPDIRDDENAIKAREGFAYFLETESASGIAKSSAVQKLILELTFTHLNRLVALKLMERRKVIRETVSRLTKSNGFIRYVVDVLGKTDFSQIGNIDAAYQDFILYQCQEVADEIKVLFDPEDLSSYVFPRPRALREVLEIINSEELADIWDSDETIGWFYQYFTPKEIREQARAESSAPRNSWELAFRNQFYTPRYVVQFLTDNTLGRMWYEMLQGNTVLSECCKYMAIPKNEVFLQQGEKPSAENNTFQVPFREKKDPRELKILDPACGSGHFLLYVFDLLVTIYKEAYADAELSKKLQYDYPDRDEFEREIPRLILENNLYGIDIDMRAIQIAALALWLRAQREWNEMDVRRDDRPKIRNAHFVCAEPMPGNEELFEDFVATLKPALLGRFVRDVWEEMKLAGEAGSLLQIEKELRATIQKAKQEWLSLPKETQLTLFGEPETYQLTLDFKGIKDEAFFKEAEEKVFSALRTYAERVIAENHGYGRKLFAEESIRGFQFIETLQNRFDVVLMNPPFGETSPATKALFQQRYPEWNRNVLCAFIHRMLDLTTQNGSLGVIFDRTAVVKSSYEKFRQNILIGRNALFSMADTGWEVLEANVETTTMVFQKNLVPFKHHPAFFFDVRNIHPDNKGERLLEKVGAFRQGEKEEGVYIANPDEFEKLPNSVIGYDVPRFLQRILPKCVAFERATVGLQAKAELFFRAFWEYSVWDLGRKYKLFYNGGEYSLFYLPIYLTVNWENNGSKIKAHPSSRQENKNYFEQGLCYGKRGDFLDVHILPPSHIYSVEGQGIPLESELDSRWYFLSLLNSSFFQFVVNYFCGQHKTVKYVNLFPIIKSIDYELKMSISVISHQGYHLKSTWYLGDETNYQFEKPWIVAWLEKVKEYKGINDILEALIAYEQEADKELERISAEIDSKTLELYGVTDPEDIAVVEKAVERRPKDVLWKETRGYSEEQKKLYHVESLLSFWVGCLFGRWDAVNGSFYDERLVQNSEIFDLREVIRKKADELWEKDEIIAEPTKFALSEEEIKACPKVKYPYTIDSDGIIPLDEGHPEDLVKSVEIAAGVTFGEENAEQVIREIEAILGQELRTYFSRDFFGSHANRYLKKPIYLLLQSSNRTYSIYVYYHKIDSDTLFKIVRNYIEPKINMVSSEIEDINVKIETSKGQEKWQLEKEKAKLEESLQEIVGFKESVEKIIALGFALDMDDGIAVNIAPFKDVILWNEAHKYWDALESGKCDWSKLAMKLWSERVKRKCEKDKSLAIAHGMDGEK